MEDQHGHGHDHKVKSHAHQYQVQSTYTVGLCSYHISPGARDSSFSAGVQIGGIACRGVKMMLSFFGLKKWLGHGLAFGGTVLQASLCSCWPFGRIS